MQGRIPASGRTVPGEANSEIRCSREIEREIVTEATQSGGVLKTRGSNDHSIRG